MKRWRSNQQDADHKPTHAKDTATPTLSRAGAALIAALLFFFFALIWLVLVWLTSATRHTPDPRNTIENLLARNPSIRAEDLTGSEFSSAGTLPGLPEPKTNLSPAELAFGERQMARMVKDRPELKRYVSRTDAVWQFCVRAFAGEVIGEPIFWENSLPEGYAYLADHQDPYQGRRGNIRIRRTYPSGSESSRPLSCEELWSCAVFEIENIRNYKAFNALFEQALKGALSREDWVRENSRLEYGALRRTAEDFARLWLPLATSRRISSNSELWAVDIPTTYESWISLYRDPAGYPWNAYGRYYDRQIVPYVRSAQRSQGVHR